MVQQDPKFPERSNRPNVCPALTEATRISDEGTNHYGARLVRKVPETANPKSWWLPVQCNVVERRAIPEGGVYTPTRTQSILPTTPGPPSTKAAWRLQMMKPHKDERGSQSGYPCVGTMRDSACREPRRAYKASVVKATRQFLSPRSIESNTGSPLARVSASVADAVASPNGAGRRRSPLFHPMLDIYVQYPHCLVQGRFTLGYTTTGDATSQDRAFR
jgi:hypothetical protein